MKVDSNATFSNTYTQLKDGKNMKYLYYANDMIITFINDIETIFIENIYTLMCEANVKSHIIKIIKANVITPMNICKSLKYMIVDLYIKMRLFYFAKFFSIKTSVLKENLVRMNVLMKRRIENMLR